MDLEPPLILALLVALLLALRRRATRFAVLWERAVAHFRKSRWEEATRGFQRSLGLEDAQRHPSPSRVARCLDMIVISLRMEKKLEDADAFAERALGMVDIHSKRYPGAMANVLRNAALLRLDQGRHAEARELVTRARELAALSRAAVAEQVEMAAATVFAATGSSAEAIDVASELPIKKATAGVTKLARLAVVCLRAGEVERASKGLARVVDRVEKDLEGGRGQPHVRAFFRSLYGEALLAKGEPAAALDLVVAALEEYERIDAPKASIANALLLVARAQLALGQHDHARRACERVLAIDGHPSPPRDPYRESSGDPLDPERRVAAELLEQAI